jgi:hypothetical protein
VIQEAMEFLIKQAKKTELTKINGFQYAMIDGEFPKRIVPPKRDTITVESLEGLACAYDHMIGPGMPAFINVRSPHIVQILLDATEDTDLDYPVVCEANCVEFERSAGSMCDRFLRQEDFVINAYRHFHPEVGDWGSVMGVAGNLYAEESVKRDDDGVTQVASLKRGAGIKHVAIKNPVMLASRLTFPEVPPQPSPYILRVRTDGDPAVALFEVHGGAWARHVREAIAAWLNGRLDEMGYEPIILL